MPVPTEIVTRQTLTSKNYPSKTSLRVWNKAKKLIANGVQTLSKQPNKFVEGQYPIFLEEGLGCYVKDDKYWYIDYPCSLGANLLGHANPEIAQAIVEQFMKGTLFTLPHRLETELAEKLHRLIPCAEQMRFLKTGSEATSAAVRIARSYTGKMGIAYCGYHGWHDWFTADTPKNQGIPSGSKCLIDKFEYNNLDSLHKILDGDGVGVVILEPYIYEAPKDKFLHKVIKLSHKHGAVVIFDEVVTGFRTKGYSAQKMFNVTPDLACFGKAMANGLPISVVCGKKKIMSVLDGDTFVSSTFGGELLSIVAALKTIEILERDKVLDHIDLMGRKLQNGYNFIASTLNIETSCIGFPNRTMFMFPSGEHKSLFWQECIKRGVLFGYAQFINYSHKSEDIEYTLKVIEEALIVCKKNWVNPRKAIVGKPAGEVFRLCVTKENKVVN
jgi:glutamate-1-semialdehyde 2,1-aminomutase/spore coat polysaccharide biosynthesis protein SpsF